MNRRIIATLLITLFTLFIVSSTWAATFKIGEADCTLYGSARIETGYRITDYGDVPATYSQDTKGDFYMENPGDSRIGFKASYGDITGVVEIGICGNSFANKISTRHAYGQYDMGDGNTLIIGQTWSLFAHGFNWQRQYYDLALQGFGNFYGNRNEQVQFVHAGEDLIFKIAVENSKVSSQAFFSGATLGGGETYLAEDKIPAVLASVSWKPVKNITITPSVMFQEYTLKSTTVGDPADDVDILTWGAAVNGCFKTAPVIVNVEAWYGQNLGLYGFLFEMRPGVGILNRSTPNPATTYFGMPAVDDTYDIEDVNTYGGFIEFTIPVDEKLAVNIGAGYQEAETGLNKADGYEEEISTMGTYLNCKYDFTPGFYVQPEIAFFDYGDDATGGTDLGTDTFIGLFFEFDF